MTTRITGLVSGLDVDALVEAGSSFYQGKLDEAKQKQQKLQWEQTAYQSIATDATTFYNKYLDIASSDCITKSSNWNTNSYTSSNSAVTAEEVGSANIANYTVNVTQLATATKAEVSTNVLKPNTASQITINGNTYTLNSSDANNNAIVSDLNSQLSTAGQAVTVSYSDFANNGAGGFVIQNNANGNINLTVSSTSAGVGDIALTQGTYLNATIKNGTNTYTIDDSKALTTNNVTLDNVKFTFNDVTTTSGAASITGSSDVSDVEKKIESFVNDYNTLIGQINTQYYTSYNNDYQPLTDAEKKSMSDSDISAWNAQAQTGLLHGDDNLDRLASQMKDAMSTFMKSSGVDLESFGITPVQDYSTQNGVYTIDSDKLKAALEDPTKFSQIQSLFCDGISDINSYTTSNSSTDGIAARLKVALNVNVTTPTSVFSELCGTSNNPVTLTTNEFYKELQDQSDLITNYQTQLSDQENALYEKYSQLETQLTEMQSSSSVFSSSSSN